MSDSHVEAQVPGPAKGPGGSALKWIGPSAVVLGAALMALAVYLAPSAAYEIQAPFREQGEQTTGTVVSKQIKERSYQGGGRRGGGKRTYQEREVVVQLASKSDGTRKVTIDDLVLSGDYEALSEGDEVSVTLIRGKTARKGPSYLLTSSVDAGTFSLLGWAFGGRPASGAAIAAAISGLVFLVLGGVLVLIRRDARKSSA